MSPAPLAHGSILARNENVRGAQLGDEQTALMSLETDSYYNLGSVGSEIWGILSAETTLSDLITQLVDRFDVSRSECEKQVVVFLERLIADDLIVVRNE